MQKMFWHLILPRLDRSILEQNSVTTSQQRSRVIAIINLSIRDEINPHISHLESPKKVWNAQKEFYESIRTIQRLLLRSKFYKLNMQETSNVSNFLFVIKDLLGQITRMGDIIADENVVLTVLNALPKLCKNFVQGVLA